MNSHHQRLFSAKSGTNLVWYPPRHFVFTSFRNYPGTREEEMYFRYFGIMSPWKGCDHPTERKKTRLKSFCPGMHFDKFGWNWPSGFGKEYENMKSLQTDGRMDNGLHTLIKIRVHYRYTRTQFLLSKGQLKNKAWNYISNLGGNFKVCVYGGGGYKCACHIVAYSL